MRERNVVAVRKDVLVVAAGYDTGMSKFWNARLLLLLLLLKILLVLLLLPKRLPWLPSFRFWPNRPLV